MGCECCFMLTLNEIFVHPTAFKAFMSSMLGSRLYCVSVLMSLCASTVRIRYQLAHRYDSVLPVTFKSDVKDKQTL